MNHMPSALPVPLTRFVGRDRERAEVSRLIRSQRLVTLTGAGGVGKTRLALEVAASSADGFDDGVRLVELGALSEAQFVLPCLAEALGVHEQPGVGLLEQVNTQLTEQHVLLVLDNCEHLVETCARLMNVLLRTCARLHVLVTSREPLGIDGETAWRVPSLSLPWPGQATSAEVALRSEAVQLFAERATAARPGFAVTDGNAATVARICFSLDGIPLALELAAARLRMLSIAQIAARLEERFRLLTGGNRVAPRRQQTLRATLDWSYELLTPDERVLFSHLSVFSGGWSLDAAEAICRSSADSGVLELVGRLVDRSLVVVEDVDRDMRYRLMESVRLYAEERLRESADWSVVHNAHLEFYTRFAEEAERELWGALLGIWSRRLESEHDNLRAALRWALDIDNVETALRLAGALGRFWALHAHLSEGQQWLEEALGKLAESRGSVRARALNAAGGLARDRGDYMRAASHFGECVAMVRLLGTPRSLALALGNLALTSQLAGDSERALTAIEESLAISYAAADRQGIASSLMTVGVVRRQRNEFELAESALAEALGVFEELGDRRGMAASLNNLGNLANSRKNLAAARVHYERSLDLLRQLGDAREVAASLLNLALVARDQRDARRAADLARQSLTGLMELGDYGGAAACVEVLAGLAVENERALDAARLFGAAAALAASAGTALPALNPDDYAARTTALEQYLGSDAYARARATGHRLTPDEAAGLALADHEATATTLSSDQPRLTNREREVARLLAQGLTNRQIADELVIAPGTAALHVEHLRVKLGCHSRAQIAAWAVAHGVVDDQAVPTYARGDTSM